MLKKFKFKFYTVGAIAILLTCLTGCGYHSAHNEQGYTQEVIYDLGEGVCKANNRETNKLTVYYLPGSHITDFSDNKEYVFTRANSADGSIKYELEGWYLDKEYEHPVDFETYTLPEDKEIVTTIYAKWEEIFDKHFNIYYQPENSAEFTLLKTLQWELNKPFKYSSNNIEYPSDEEYTFIGAYIDEEMTTAVDNNYLLTKDGEDLPIYTKWIKGHYRVVNTPSEFRSYFDRYVLSYDLYLNADIDLSGVTLPRLSILNGRTILGNHHTISNLTYSTLSGENGSKTTVTLGGLADTIENCTIKDLKITNATYTMHVVTCKYLQFGALAGTIKSSTIDNVSINGTITYAEDTLKRLENETLIAVRIADGLAYSIDESSVITNDQVDLSTIMYDLKEE